MRVAVALWLMLLVDVLDAVEVTLELSEELQLGLGLLLQLGERVTDLVWVSV